MKLPPHRIVQIAAGAIQLAEEEGFSGRDIAAGFMVALQKLPLRELVEKFPEHAATAARFRAAGRQIGRALVDIVEEVSGKRR